MHKYYMIARERKIRKCTYRVLHEALEIWKNLTIICLKYCRCLSEIPLDVFH